MVESVENSTRDSANYGDEQDTLRHVHFRTAVVMMVEGIIKGSLFEV